MARDPLARRYTISYPKGTMHASLGLLNYLFGPQALDWPPGGVEQGPSGRRRFKYGGRQKAAAAAGEEVFLDLGAVGVFSVRVSGAMVDFLQYILPATENKILAIWTKRGTEWGQVPGTIQN